mmetsp:Transcript_25214/g.64035  ORF Transcript_25214/g.64035 Transcript_25214/m.64035 type:complete len:220 (-) Transcript_25214:1275-1934(-)
MGSIPAGRRKLVKDPHNEGGCSSGPSTPVCQAGPITRFARRTPRTRTLPPREPGGRQRASGRAQRQRAARVRRDRGGRHAGRLCGRVPGHARLAGGGGGARRAARARAGVEHQPQGDDGAGGAGPADTRGAGGRDRHGVQPGARGVPRRGRGVDARRAQLRRQPRRAHHPHARQAGGGGRARVRARGPGGRDRAPGRGGPVVALRPHRHPPGVRVHHQG